MTDGVTAAAEALVADVLAGRRKAIARLMSVAEQTGRHGREALAEIHRHAGRAHKGRCTAAARDRGFAGKALQKALTARFCQFHDRFLPR